MCTFPHRKMPSYLNSPWVYQNTDEAWIHSSPKPPMVVYSKFLHGRATSTHFHIQLFLSPTTLVPKIKIGFQWILLLGLVYYFINWKDAHVYQKNVQNVENGKIVVSCDCKHFILGLLFGNVFYKWIFLYPNSNIFPRAGHC